MRLGHAVCSASLPGQRSDTVPPAPAQSTSPLLPRLLEAATQPAETKLRTPSPVVSTGHSILPPDTLKPLGPPALRPALHTDRSHGPDDDAFSPARPPPSHTPTPFLPTPPRPGRCARLTLTAPLPAQAPSQENEGCRRARSLAAKTRRHTQQDDLRAGGQKDPEARSQLGPRCLARMTAVAGLAWATRPAHPSLLPMCPIPSPARASPVPGSPRPSSGPPRKPTRPWMTPSAASCKEHAAPNWTTGRGSQDPAPVWKSPGPRTL